MADGLSFVSEGSDLSISNSSTDGGTPVITLSKSEQKIAKKRLQTERKKLEKAEKRKKKNKLSKDDFYHKTQEFKTWLYEEKNIQLDILSLEKARKWFKKFVKKWNKRQLPVKYYRGIDSLEVRMSVSDVQSTWSLAFPECLDVTNLDSPFSQAGAADAGFSTFGKKCGRQMAALLSQTSSASEHVYDEPTPTTMRTRSQSATQTPPSQHNPIEYEHIHSCKQMKSNGKVLSKRSSPDVLPPYTMPQKKRKCASNNSSQESIYSVQDLADSKLRTGTRENNPPMGLVASTMIKKNRSLEDLLGFSPSTHIPLQSPGHKKESSGKVVKEANCMYNIMPKDQEYVYLQTLRVDTPTFL